MQTLYSKCSFLWKQCFQFNTESKSQLWIDCYFFQRYTNEGDSIVQWVKCLTRKHWGARIGIPRTHVKKSGVMVHAWNPSAEKGRDRISETGLLASSPPECARPRWSRDLAPEVRYEQLRKTLHADLWPPCTHVHTQTTHTKYVQERCHDGSHAT